MKPVLANKAEFQRALLIVHLTPAMSQFPLQAFLMVLLLLHKVLI